ncbi:MAG: hypothetical protein WA655_19230 [Candidatus Korobacteraceae bacterium]
MVGGKYTDEVCIAVLVDQKKPLDQLTANEVVPPEIDGVKTDVREIPRPRLLMAADPSNLIATIGANPPSVTFSSAKDTPGQGLVVVLEYTVGPAGSPTPHIGSYSTIAPDTLTTIATNLAAQMTQSNIPGITVAAAGAQVTITPAAGMQATITACPVTAADDAKYFKDHLRGGIQIQSGGSLIGGTLGFLAMTAATPQAPQGKVVAVTCLHVVAPSIDIPTNLTAAANANQIGFGVSDNNQIVPDSLVQVVFGPPLTAAAFYTTRVNDTLNDIADGVVAAVTQANLTGVSAVDAGLGVVTFTSLPPQVAVACYTFGPNTVDPDVSLTATVVGPQLTLSGSVSDENYGIYTRVNAGGLRRTCGVFLNPTKSDTPDSIASAIITAFNKLPDDYRGGVTATPIASGVNFAQAQSVECRIRNDIQVGQPDNSFGSTCSHCCSHRIGRVLDAQVAGDIAIIQVDAGQKWVPEIEGLGLVGGVHGLEPTDLHNLVLKRGRTMPTKVQGRIDMLQVSGDIFGEGQSLDRHYVNAICISSTTPGPFVLAGDSGAAITDLLGGLMGVVFGGADLIGWATPIDQIITDDFPDLQLNPAPAPEAGHAPGDVRTVPKSAMAAATEEDAAAIASPQPFLEKRLAQVEKEISSTPEGFEYTELVKRHFAETQRLVNSNRRVATVWQRNGGPQILQAFLNMLQRRDEPLPTEIDGQSFVDCLERIKQVFARYASPAFAADLSRLAPRLESFAGLTYNQLLAALRSESGD